jgi:hypothetical protein
MATALRLAAVLLMASVAPVAQDAIATLPDNYTLQFENEWVKVTRVHYPPHAKLPAHAHTALASAYVYLNDSGPVIFRHVGGESGAITRAPTKAGSFRVFRAVPDEIHEVDNTSALPSDFLRVEFKTDPGPDPRSLRGKFLPEPARDEPMQKVQFENAQIRVTRLFWPAGKTIDMASTPHPGLIICLSPGSIGHVRWIVQGTADRIENPAKTAMEALRFELKTAPK